ncbi:unnamed protein product [Linum trigynum]|uniref:ADP-ribosyl cyclase/cyclic ADP-ribose hydrolase n=1 Tax=Linum trigynum TaxID=586398 RepID=A0AAV2F5D6_9ROSI
MKPPAASSHDVFLSFRGSDVRNTFVDHLYAALRRKRVRPFKDDVDLGRGESVREGISRAIEGSSFYVVVLTRNYASSAWCLDELVKIMRCSSRDNHNGGGGGGNNTTFPIFYHLSPDDVSDVGCYYKDDFDRHKRRYTYERVDGWIQALAWVVGVAGWVVTNLQYVCT